MPNKQFTWRALWALTIPYFRSEERWSARGLLLLIVAIALANVYLDVVFNEWNKFFYDTFESGNYAEYKHQLLRFSWLAALFIILGIYRLYFNQMMQIRWRRWMTEQFLTKWLAHRTYYRLQLTGGKTDNPDQRISEDIKQFVGLSLGLALGLLSAVVTLASFLAILWTLSGSYEIEIAGMAIEIPGYMVWAAIVYAFAGTWIINRVGRPLFGLNFAQQRFEADFRFGLMRLRENAEAVALYGGEAREHAAFRLRFADVATNWWALMKRTKLLGWFTYGYGQLAIIFPFVVAAPRFFDKTIKLGDLMQIASAFGQVQSSLSFIINAYSTIAEWRAVVERLLTYQAAMDAAASAAVAQPMTVERAATTRLTADDLTLQLPDGRTLTQPVTFAIDPGETVLVSGPSGSGKSTIFRALAGIWPFGRGRIRIPADAKAQFIPQKPYMPVGTLAEALSYPEPADATTEAAKRHALMDVGLPALVERLNDDQNWGQALSPGEQQRVAFARVLLKKPNWVFLDEATASLDTQLEEKMYALLCERLPGLTVVSIGHRPALARFHRRRLSIVPGREGAMIESSPIPA
ncbi:MAG: ABC transporter ATP-binding protein/permease [Alphaproteobacteria bacterium]|nr:ABC transporter ATP-binding protein/permease [Alphaproteobacteria bacterium]